MNRDLFRGQLVRLAASNSDTDAEALVRWSRDSQYLRLLDAEIARPISLSRAKELTKEFLEPDEPKLDAFAFVIRTLADDHQIGFVDLDGVQWSHGDTFVGIGIGDRSDWNKGYGTDALRIILRYAFMELNMHRVSLTVFAYNPRAIHSYEKAGFTHEGRLREFLNRDGQRYDLLFMGILREEWEQAEARRLSA
jgi:RimJ/RimL family protein N-acetyltransferase